MQQRQWEVEQGSLLSRQAVGACDQNQASECPGKGKKRRLRADRLRTDRLTFATVLPAHFYRK